MTPVIIIIVGATLINFTFCPNKMYYTIKSNLWFGNISITIITVHIIIKGKFIYFLCLRKQQFFIGAINSNNGH